MTSNPLYDVVVVGAGFTGLSAAHALAKTGLRVAVIEADASLGGLAGAFEVAGNPLDKFYHHWFTSDTHVMDLIREVGLAQDIMLNPTNTGIYYANNFFKLSTPWDLLRFTPLSLFDRIRLGLLTLRARRVTDWQALESLTAQEWLLKLGGKRVYDVVWRPLLLGKFGPYAESVSAVWFWNKLKLRGGSRGKDGVEQLAYLHGGFIRLADALAERIRHLGGKITLSQPVQTITRSEHGWQVTSADQQWQGRRVLVTTALPLAADFIADWADTALLHKLRGIDYLGNTCLVLELSRPLSGTYWLNINDPSFPFVGVIEHTNFEDAAHYGGHHIVYLSKYLPHTDPLYAYDADTMLAYALPYLRRMFPDLDASWILKHHLWKARWSQPVVIKHYNQLIPDSREVGDGFYLASMAQIYPEDRGTNYAVREGLAIADAILADLNTAGTTP